MPMKTARRPIEAPSPVRWENTIVLCAANRWDTVKLADRHMAERLSAHAPVLYVDPPVSHLTRLINPAIATALDGPRLRIVAPNIARYTPVVPPKPMHPAVVRSTEYVIRRELRNTIAQLGGDVRAVVSTWLFVNVYGFLGEQHRVYWWQDDPIGAADHWGASAARLAAADERLGRSSDLVVAVNEGAVERWRQRGVRTEFLPNGCDIESFADDDLDCPSDVTLPHPIAGFVGHINSRTDLSLLESVATGGTSLLLIGPKDPLFEPERFRRLTERPNVSWLGARRFEELPPYLSSMDVGLVPYRRDGVQPFQLPDEDAGVPRRRIARRVDVPAGCALARHTTRVARRRCCRLRPSSTRGGRPREIRRTRRAAPIIRRAAQLGRAGRSSRRTRRADLSRADLADRLADERGTTSRTTPRPLGCTTTTRTKATTPTAPSPSISNHPLHPS